MRPKSDKKNWKLKNDCKRSARSGSADPSIVRPASVETIAEDHPIVRDGGVIAEMIAEMIALDLMIGAEAMKIVVIELIGAIVDSIGMIVIAVIVELGNQVAVDGAIVNVVRMRIGLRDDEMMIKIVIADLIVDLLVEMIEMIKEAIGVVEILVIVEMIVPNVGMILAIAEMIHEIVGMILEMIADSIVDLLVEMIEMIVDRHVEMIGMIAEEVEVGDRLHEMIVGMIVDLPVETIVGTIAEMIASVVAVIGEMIAVVIVKIVGMIVVAIVMLIIGVPDLELCLHPRTIAVIVHLGMDHLEMIHHPNDPKVIKNLKMTDGVKLLNVNKCLIYSSVVYE